MDRTGLTTEDHVEIWRRYRTGESMRSISRALRPSLDQIEDPDRFEGNAVSSRRGARTRFSRTSSRSRRRISRSPIRYSRR